MLKGSAVTATVEIGAEAEPLRLHHGHIPRRLTIEAREIAQHRPKARAQQVAPLGEEAAEIGAGIFETAVFHRNREGHLRGGRLDSEMFEQGRQIGIGRFIVDNETGIDAAGAVRRRDMNGVGMSTCPVIGFVERHAMALAQQPGT